jgi:ParB family chromosome partitioning protein
MVDVVSLPVSEIFGNPDQPRQDFDPKALQELADSIAAQGLLQPITVTPRDGRFMIVAGERRFRAHVLLGLDTVAAIVAPAMDDRAVMLQAIIENAQRRDVNPMEEAVAYGRLVSMGMTPDDIASQTGAPPFRVRWRLSLLTLEPEFQTLARSGQLTPAQALELATLETGAQRELFRAINAGQCETTLALKAKGAELRQAAAQIDAFADLARPSESSRRLAQGFEARVRKLAATLRESTVDNEVVAVRKVDPTRADTLADLFAAMRGDLERIERALRQMSAQELIAA